MYCKWLGRLQAIECFDPLFFSHFAGGSGTHGSATANIFGGELQGVSRCRVWRATIERTQLRCVLGMMGGEYGLLLQRAGQGAGDTTGNSAAIAAARIAYT